MSYITEVCILYHFFYVHEHKSSAWICNLKSYDPYVRIPKSENKGYIGMNDEFIYSVQIKTWKNLEYLFCNFCNN